MQLSGSLERDPGWSRRLLPLFLLAAVYAVLGRWGLNHQAVNGFATPIWVPTGLSLAVLFLFGRGFWPGVMLGAFLVNLLQGAIPPLALFFAVGNTLEAIVGSALLHIVGFRASLTRVRDVFFLIGLGGVLSTMISASIGVLSLILFESTPASAALPIWKIWWTGNLLSNLVVAPFLLIWLQRENVPVFSWQRALEVLGLVAFLATIIQFVFGRPFDLASGKLTMPYLIFPPLVWASLRFGPRGASTATFLTAVSSLFHTLEGLGPFGFRLPGENLSSLQLFMGVMAVTALVFAALVAERAESREALRRSHEELEQNVEHRTKELIAANALLKESEERFRLLIDGVKDYAIFGLDPTGHVVTWNSGAERAKGYRAMEILGQHFSRFYTAEDIQAGKPDYLLQQARDKGHVRDEGWRVKKDGSIIFADILISALRDKNGVLKGYTKISRDITERKKLDERLRKSQEQLTEAQRIARLGHWEWDILKNTVSWSEELLQIYGLSAQQTAFEFKDVLRVTHPQDRRALKNTLRAAMNLHQPFSLDFRILKGKKEERFLHALGRVTVDSHGKPVRMVGTAQDVTSEKRAERALQQKEEELFQARKLEAIGRLAGGVAHDFNNLITGILGISQELKKTFGSEDPRSEDIEEVIKASNRAFDVTRQLLAFSRRQIMSPKVIDITETIQDFSKLLHRLLGEDIRLDLHLTDHHYIKMDPGNLEQVLLNLALNARDAMPQGGTISLSTRNVSFQKDGGPSTAHILLEVSDTGKGMTQDILSHIFEPFFTTKTRDKGTGLGLATVYGIVKQSGGDIVVDSQLGRGTTFRIYLPREMQPPAEAASTPKTVPHPPGHETVLIIEDEAIVRKVVVKRLRSAGYEVLEASGGKKALELLDTHGPSIKLVITDVVMPEMNGREVVERIRQSYPSVSVLYMSGYPEEIIARRGTLEPGINFIEKSAIHKDLLKKVREILEKSVSPPLKRAAS
jgi:two-component system, cell cycle sensor histidine kinase and response regulator CckA